MKLNLTKPLVIFDLETTGLEIAKDRIIQLSYIKVYPEGKEEITGYRYEPWHVRYLGEIAKDVYESGLCLEEYLGITSSYENCPLCNAETNK